MDGEVPKYRRTGHLPEELASKLSHSGTLSKQGAIDAYLSSRSPAEVFNEFDTDGDGVLDMGEFVHLLDSVGIHLPEAQAVALFRRIDLDDDGFLSQDEWAVAFYSLGIKEGAPSGTGMFNAAAVLTPLDAFYMFDSSYRGALDEVELSLVLEFLGVQIDEDKLDRVFASADADKSGLLEYEEFRNVWLQMVDAKEELAKRGEVVNGWVPSRTLVQRLEEKVLAEERRREQSLAEARAWYERYRRQKQRLADAAKARALAEQEVALALDAAGSVFMFGPGPAGEFFRATQPITGEQDGPVQSEEPGDLAMHLWLDRTGQGRIAKKLRSMEEARHFQKARDEFQADVLDVDEELDEDRLSEERQALKQAAIAMDNQKKGAQWKRGKKGAGGMEGEETSAAEDAAKKDAEQKAYEAGAAAALDTDSGSDSEDDGDSKAGDDGDDTDESLDETDSDATASTDEEDSEDDDEEEEEDPDAVGDDGPSRVQLATALRDYGTPREGLGARVGGFRKLNAFIESKKKTAAARKLMREALFRQKVRRALAETSPYLRRDSRDMMDCVVAANTAHFWGMQVTKASVGTGVAAACTALGQLYVWGGRQDDREAQRHAANETLAASQALLALRREAALRDVVAGAGTPGSATATALAVQRQLPYFVLNERARGGKQVRTVAEYVASPSAAALMHRLQRAEGMHMTGMGVGGTDRRIRFARMWRADQDPDDPDRRMGLEAAGREGWGAAKPHAFDRSGKAKSWQQMRQQYDGTYFYKLGMPTDAATAMRSLPPLPGAPAMLTMAPDPSMGMRARRDEEGMASILFKVDGGMDTVYAGGDSEAGMEEDGTVVGSNRSSAGRASDAASGTASAATGSSRKLIADGPASGAGTVVPVAGEDYGKGGSNLVGDAGESKATDSGKESQTEAKVTAVKPLPAISRLQSGQPSKESLAAPDSPSEMHQPLLSPRSTSMLGARANPPYSGPPAGKRPLEQRQTWREQVEEVEVRALRKAAMKLGTWREPPPDANRLRFVRRVVVPAVPMVDLRLALNIRGLPANDLTANNRTSVLAVRMKLLEWLGTALEVEEEVERKIEGVASSASATSTESKEDGSTGNDGFSMDDSPPAVIPLGGWAAFDQRKWKMFRRREKECSENDEKLRRGETGGILGYITGTTTAALAQNAMEITSGIWRPLRRSWDLRLWWKREAAIRMREKDDRLDDRAYAEMRAQLARVCVAVAGTKADSEHAARARRAGVPPWFAPGVVDRLLADAESEQGDKLKDMVSPTVPSQAGLSGTTAAGVGGWETIERLHDYAADLGVKGALSVSESSKREFPAAASGGTGAQSQELALLAAREGPDDAYESRQAAVPLLSSGKTLTSIPIGSLDVGGPAKLPSDLGTESVLAMAGVEASAEDKDAEAAASGNSKKHTLGEIPSSPMGRSSTATSGAFRGLNSAGGGTEQQQAKRRADAASKTKQRRLRRLRALLQERTASKQPILMPARVYDVDCGAAHIGAADEWQGCMTWGDARTGRLGLGVDPSRLAAFQREVHVGTAASGPTSQPAQRSSRGLALLEDAPGSARSGSASLQGGRAGSGSRLSDAESKASSSPAKDEDFEAQPWPTTVFLSDERKAGGGMISRSARQPHAIRSLSLGYGHTAVVTAEGEAWVWGDASQGALGLGVSPVGGLRASRWPGARPVLIPLLHDDRMPTRAGHRGGAPRRYDPPRTPLAIMAGPRAIASRGSLPGTGGLPPRAQAEASQLMEVAKQAKGKQGLLQLMESTDRELQSTRHDSEGMRRAGTSMGASHHGYLGATSPGSPASSRGNATAYSPGQLDTPGNMSVTGAGNLSRYQLALRSTAGRGGSARGGGPLDRLSTPLGIATSAVARGTIPRVTTSRGHGHQQQGGHGSVRAAVSRETPAADLLTVARTGTPATPGVPRHIAPLAQAASGAGGSPSFPQDRRTALGRELTALHDGSPRLEGSEYAHRAMVVARDEQRLAGLRGEQLPGFSRRGTRSSGDHGSAALVSRGLGTAAGRFRSGTALAVQGPDDEQHGVGGVDGVQQQESIRRLTVGGAETRAEAHRAATALSGVMVPVPVRLRLPAGFGRSPIRQVACGAAHTAIVTESGHLFVCGSGAGGRLGLGAKVLPAVVPHPVLVEALARAGVRIVEASCGMESTLVRSELVYNDIVGGGAVKDAGVDDEASEPADPFDSPRTAAPGNESARSVRPVHTDPELAGAQKLDPRGLFGEVEGGAVYATGVRWALGEHASQEFKRVGGLPPARQVCAGASHQAVVTAAGELWTWGENDKGAAGHPRGKKFLPGPKRVRALYKAPRNLALGQPCRQSSTYAQRHAFLAVDGTIKGDSVRHCAWTQREDEPWLEVDLGRDCYVSAVEVYVHHGTRASWIGGGGMDATGRLGSSSSSRSQQEPGRQTAASMRAMSAGGLGQDGAESVVSLVSDDGIEAGRPSSRAGTVTTRQLREAMASRGYASAGIATTAGTSRSYGTHGPVEETDAPRPVGGPAARTDATSRRFLPLHVLLARQDRPFPAVIGKGTLRVSKEVAVASCVHTSGRRLLSWQPPPMTRARFVRIVLDKNEHLAVAQVRVLGTSSRQPPRMPVRHVSCGRAAMSVVTAARTDNETLLTHYRRAIAADPRAAKLLRRIPAYAPFFDVYGDNYLPVDAREQDEESRRPPSPREARRRQQRAMRAAQRDRRKRYMKEIEKNARTVGKRGQGRRERRLLQRQAVSKQMRALDEEMQKEKEAGLYDVDDTLGDSGWRGEALRSAKELLARQDCAMDPAANNCPLCEPKKRCASCEFHLKWVQPFALRSFHRQLRRRAQHDKEDNYMLVDAAERKAKEAAEAAARAAAGRTSSEEQEEDSEAGAAKGGAAEEGSYASASGDGAGGDPVVEEALKGRVELPPYRRWQLQDVLRAVLVEEADDEGVSQLETLLQRAAVTGRAMAPEGLQEHESSRGGKRQRD